MASAEPSASSAAEIAAVSHLVELGYSDPQDAARQRAGDERELDAELARTQGLLDGGQVDEAIGALDALTRAAPEWSPPRRLLAIACYRAGEVAAAREHLEWLELHAVEQAPLALLRATIELSQRQFDAALDQAGYARHLDQSLPGPELVIGEAYLRRGELDAAGEAFQRAAELAPNDAGGVVRPGGRRTATRRLRCCD